MISFVNLCCSLDGTEWIAGRKVYWPVRNSLRPFGSLYETRYSRFSKYKYYIAFDIATTQKGGLPSVLEASPST